MEGRHELSKLHPRKDLPHDSENAVVKVDHIEIASRAPNI